MALVQWCSRLCAAVGISMNVRQVSSSILIPMISMSFCEGTMIAMWRLLGLLHHSRDRHPSLARLPNQFARPRPFPLPSSLRLSLRICFLHPEVFCICVSFLADFCLLRTRSSRSQSQIYIRQLHSRAPWSARCFIDNETYT